MDNFKALTQLRFWCQKVLPLVYDDSLSYYEVLCKVQQKLNDLIENNNLLPDYIMKLIRDYISSGEIEKVLADILANYMLNVKFPPTGLTPATGDGTKDDTQAIQGCIDYAFSHGGMAVYFPSGKYLTQPLTLRNKATLFGQDRYTTQLVMKGGATKAMFTGTVDELSLTGLGFDGNMDIQVNNVNLFDITVNSAIISNALLTDGYVLLNANVNDNLQLSNVIFKHAVEVGLKTTGNGFVQADNIIFNTLSTLVGKSFVVLGTSNSNLEKIKCVGAAPVGVTLNGNNNVVKFWGDSCLTPYVNSGVGNSILCYNKNEIDTLSSDRTMLTGGNSSETITGNKTISSTDLIENVGRNKTVEITGNVSEKVVGNKQENLKNLTQVISDDKSVNAKNLTETLTENITLESGKDYKLTVKGNSLETVTGTKTTTITGDETQKGSNLTQTLTGALTTNVGTNSNQNVTGNSVETVIGNKEIKSKDIFLNPTNPLKYGTPRLNTDGYTVVDMKDKSDVPYEIILMSAALKKGGVITNITEYGAKGNGTTDDTQAIKNCINALPDGAIVYFPTGTYLISQTITVNKALIFIGKATFKTNAALLPMFTVTAADAEFQNMIFDANNKANGIIRIESNDVKINNCTFLNMGMITDSTASNYHAILFWGGANGIVTNCNFNKISPLETGTPQVRAITFNSGSGCPVVDNCTFIECYQGVVCAELASPPINKTEIVTVKNCRFYNITDNSVYALEYVDTIRLQNNVVENGLDEGFVILCNNNYITNCTFNGGSNKSIAIEDKEGIKNIIIQGCVFNVTSANSSINCRNASGKRVKNLIISDNVINATYDLGNAAHIHLLNCDNISVTNNIINTIAGDNSPIVRFAGGGQMVLIANNTIIGKTDNALAFSFNAGDTYQLSNNRTVKCRFMIASNVMIKDFINANIIASNVYSLPDVSPFINGSTAPSSGKWTRGAFIRNLFPSATTKIFGWVCTQDGEFGTGTLPVFTEVKFT